MSQEDVVSILRSCKIGDVVSLTISRQVAADAESADSAATCDPAEAVSGLPRTSAAAVAAPPPRTGNGDDCPSLNAARNGENVEEAIPADSGVDYIPLSIAVDRSDERGSLLGASIKGKTTTTADGSPLDLGLFVNAIIEGSAAEKVRNNTETW